MNALQANLDYMGKLKLKFRLKSIRQRFTFALAAVITAIMLIFSFILIGYNNKFLEKDLRLRLDTLTELTVKSLSNALWQYNFEYISDYIDSLFLYEELAFASVSTDSKTINKKLRQTFKGKDFAYFKESSKFITKEAAVMHKKVVIGKVFLALSRERIDSLIVDNSALAISLLFLIILAIFITNYILSRKYLFQPLTSLENSARSIAEGRLDTQIDTRSEDEIGKLARTFSQMMQSIKAITASRDELNHEIAAHKRAEKEKKELETKLQRAQKMEAMGLMAGGVAHDLNNILSGIVSYPELLLMDLPEDSPMRKPIKTMQESGMRAADVVEDLMTIARGVASSKEPLNLNTVVEEYLNSVEHQNLERTHSFVDFKPELDSDLLNMSGSPIHIKKILMNLVTNASEAIEGSGTVTIFTRNQYLDEPLKGYEDVVTGEYIVLTVSDGGSGISQQDLERIFEPFYTKKVMERSGTGLGLAVVWNTVQDHKGYIDVKSSKKGTVFELYFPVTRDEIAEDKEDVPVAEYQGHGEKILVVDDEENQREIACGMLTKLGYNAESVSSGEEAIKYVRENPVDLVVLDMVMPKGINGRKTYEEIIKIRPGQKAIIASGYAKTKEVNAAQELGAGKYIKKPYVLEKLGVAVKRELEK